MDVNYNDITTYILKLVIGQSRPDSYRRSVFDTHQLYYPKG